MSAILKIKEALAHWPPSGGMDKRDLGEDEISGPHLRLWQALRTARDAPHDISSRDLASLMRHSLRNEEERFGGRFEVTVPTEVVSPWPGHDTWKEHGFGVRQVGHQYRIHATRWKRPGWLEPLHTDKDSDSNYPLGPADQAQKRRPETKAIPLDPALSGKFASIDSYWSNAQAEAIRGVMLSPKGSSHLMIYPTGSGKSLIGLAASMAGRTHPSGITIVVVPTVALALDQVEQARKSFPEAKIDAWESGTPLSIRLEIKERVRSGTQTFLYTSPESLTGSLKPDLLEAARSGLLQTFIVDEAHLVSQWGSAFRPSFQTMTALWRELRRLTPFRTLLMSATVTPQAFEDLKLFYDLPEVPLEISAAVHLRAEIDFYSTECEGPDDKRAKLLEILKHAPRPAILYVTKVEDAKDWYARCRQHGWARISLLHGESSVGERREAICKWRENRIDLMVATSAFGLGMDKSDVRTVIHGCVPETIDRFYQEVGRGGRDGNAAVTMMVFDSEDFELARKMSSASTIGDELGLERWTSMFHGSSEVGENTYDVNTDSLRPNLDYAGDRNRQWNMRTLVLLVRAGVLEFGYLPPPVLKQNQEESNEEFERRTEAEWSDYRATCRISLLQSNPLTESSWREATIVHRSSVSHHQRRSWNGMESVLNKAQELKDVLSDIYKVPEAGIENVPRFPTETAPSPSKYLCREVTPMLSEIATTYKFVTYPTAGVPREQTAISLSEILRIFATHGIREISLPLAWRVNAWDGVVDPLAVFTSASQERFIIVRTLEDENEHANVPDVPRISLLTPDLIDRPIPPHLLEMTRPIHLILTPEEAADPAHAHRRIGDTRVDVIPIQAVFDHLLS